MSDKPVLIMLCGAPGAGKTTFYESKLKVVFPTMLKASSSPLEQAEIDQERRRLQKEGQSFVYQHVTPDLGVIRDARAAEAPATRAYMLFLARWARQLSWKETAEAFSTRIFSGVRG
jgi:adenylate kinase family enzyme